MQIKLTEHEDKVISFLLQVVNEKTPNTTLRIAGGWVRDKLLGLQSHDIDIAIDNMSGLAFAKLVQQVMHEQGLPEKHLAVIEARPEDSKHLETVQLNVLGLVIDFVNLRKEDYADTRIPNIEPGTPKEDALRRDLTINSLFFNLNTMDIEDFSEHGLADLQAGICRTPIDPLKTFIDDPLRVMRTIRFAAKYSFHVDDQLRNAAKSSQVHEAFLKKISWDRIWTEMIGQKEGDNWKHGFLTGPNPPIALMLLAELGYRDILFRPPEGDLNPWDTDQNSHHHDLNIWDHTVSAFNYLFVDSLTENGIFSRFSNEENAIRNLAMILHDIGKCDCRFRQDKEDGTYSYKRHEEGSAEWSDIILQRINAPTDIRERVIKLVGEHMRLHMLPDKPTDKSLRKFIRDLDSDWEHSLDIAIADAYGKKSAMFDKSIRVRYEEFRTRIKYLLANQNNKTKIERPINGYDLMQHLNIKPGPKIGQLFNALDEELLENPNMTREEAFAFIDGIKNEGVA